MGALGWGLLVTPEGVGLKDFSLDAIRRPFYGTVFSAAGFSLGPVVLRSAALFLGIRLFLIPALLAGALSRELALTLLVSGVGIFCSDYESNGGPVSEL